MRTMSDSSPDMICPLCKSDKTDLVVKLNEKPENETDFKIKDYEKHYERSIFFCNSCNVYFNKHSININAIYAGDYNKATYDNKLQARYDKIMSLPRDKSDNKQRVERILSFLDKKGIGQSDSDKPNSSIKVLDIGSGLCVFLGELKKKELNKHSFKTYCLDPDALSVMHARDYVKIDKAIQGAIENFKTEEKFGLVTFNKVLEHVKDTVSMLSKSKKFLKKEGIIYVEIPDAKGAETTNDFINQEEFFIEHNFIFTKKSAMFVIQKAGFDVLALEQIREPSGKYTIYAFMQDRTHKTRG